MDSHLAVEQQENTPRVLQGFHILRSIAMLMVFYCDMPSIPALRQLMTPLPFKSSQAGAIAVSLFFVISGYAMAYNHADESFSTWQEWVRTLWNRLSKFYPTAVIVVCLSLPLAFVGGFRERLSPISVLANLTLLQAWHLSWNLSGVVWFLSVLAFCYACYPFLAKLFRETPIPFQIALIATFWAVGIVGNWFIPGSSDFFKAFPPYRIYEFASGVALCLASSYPLKETPHSRHWLEPKRCILVAGIAWFIMIVCLQRLVPKVSHVAFYTIWTPGSIAIVKAMSYPKIALRKNAVSRIITLLSGVSFSFYMFHQVSLRYAHVGLHLLRREESLPLSIAAVFCVFFATLAFSELYNRRALAVMTRKVRGFNPFEKVEA